MDVTFLNALLLNAKVRYVRTDRETMSFEQKFDRIRSDVSIGAEAVSMCGLSNLSRCKHVRGASPN